MNTRHLVTAAHGSASKGIHMRRFVALALSSAFLLHTAPLLAAPAAARARVGGGPAQATTGAINGTAQNPGGQTLPNYTVQVRNLQTGQIAGTTTSNAAGSFSFVGLNPANYVIEVVNEAGVIVGSSASIAVAAGAAVTVTVTAAAATAIAGATAGGISTALIVTSAAAAAGVAGVVVVATRNDASPSR